MGSFVGAKAQVCNFHQFPGLRLEEDIVRLDVSVDDVLLVKGVYGV